MNLPSSLLLANTTEGPIVAKAVSRADMLQWRIESTGTACIDHSSFTEEWLRNMWVTWKRRLLVRTGSIFGSDL